MPAAETPEGSVSVTVPGFLPSTHGFRFVNYFPGALLPVALPRKSKMQRGFGLCGGMCLAAADYYRDGRPVPAGRAVPERGTSLRRYLWRRQWGSFGPLLGAVVRIAVWMLLPERARRRRTAAALREVRARLDRGAPVALAVIYVIARESPAIWENHQVLAYGYRTAPGGRLDLLIYDPNLPGDDTAILRTAPVTPRQQPDGQAITGATCVQISDRRPDKPVHGFFPIAFSPRRAPQIDTPDA